MTSDPITVPSNYTLGQFMDEVAWQQRYTTYPVVEDGQVVRLLAFSCVSSVPRDDWDARTVRECMIPQERMPELRPDEPAIDALAELSEMSVNRGVVLDRGRLVGILSAADLGRALEARPRTRQRAHTARLR